MDTAPKNLLLTEPIASPREITLTSFILEHAEALRARRAQGERAADTLPLVEQMLGRPIKLVTFASLLSRLVPAEVRASPAGERLNPPNEPGPSAPVRQSPLARAREPPAANIEIRRHELGTPEPSHNRGAASGQTEQPGVNRPIKPRLFLAKQP